MKVSLLQKVFLFALLFAFAEMACCYLNAQAGFALHAFLLLASLFLYSKTVGEEKRLWLFLALVPVLKMLSTSLQLDFINNLQQTALVYVFFIPIAVLLFFTQGMPREFLLKRPRGFDLLAAIVFGTMLGLTEHLVLSRIALITLGDAQQLAFLSAVMLFGVGFGSELVFRGMIQFQAEKLLGGLQGLLLASILYGFMHIVWKSPLELFFAVFAGLVFGILFQRTRNVYVVALAHAVSKIMLFGVLSLYVF